MPRPLGSESGSRQPGADSIGNLEETVLVRATTIALLAIWRRFFRGSLIADYGRRRNSKARPVCSALIN